MHRVRGNQLFRGERMSTTAYRASLVREIEQAMKRAQDNAYDDLINDGHSGLPGRTIRRLRPHPEPGKRPGGRVMETIRFRPEEPR